MRSIHFASGAILCAVIATLTGCDTLPANQAPSVSIAKIYQQPAEHGLINGIRLYEDGSFDAAEAALRSAIGIGLKDRQDVAAAYKYLAFIACAFNRVGECEQNFRNAMSADPQFKLSTAEIGHPVWGPAYRRVVAAAAAPTAAPKK